MWSSSEEPPGTMEAGPPESMANLKETYEERKTQLESVRDMMLRNKQSLRKKEEELEEYAKMLSKFKTRAKTARSNKDDATSSSESTPKSKSDLNSSEISQDDIDDITQARTPKAKSSLLQKKLAEDRKIFEQRSKELTESKRAVEEKVEALRQQLEEKYVAPATPVNPVLITSQTAHPVMELSHIQDKDNKITDLNNKIFDLEAIIIDLQENLKEKDSVIDSKTKAITLMSADLSMKGKTTLDTLEDTKNEMRSMQETFVLVQSSLRSKNDNLVKQLEEKNSQLSIMEENIQSLTQQLEIQKQAETVSTDISRSTLDTLADTKDEMKSMQENFILIESTLKSKNEHLLKQLEEREIKLAEAEAKILNLETGIGIERPPDLDELLYKVEKLEETNRQLEDQKYELQKNIAEIQDKFIVNEAPISNHVLLEKDNRITELETLVTELKESYRNLEDLKKSELEKQTVYLNTRNEEIETRLSELEKQLQDLENEKSELATKLAAVSTEVPKEDDQVQKLTKELEELNKSMIKLKAQHKNKLKNMQKQLENFKKVSDTNAELVKLGNQVALLEEEKGNLQLSLVDFDELKASMGDWQERINDLESKVSTQAKEIQTHIEAIAILENQKLDLMQELHSVKQEISTLEVENAESEILRVTAEMKIVDLEEELEHLHKEPTADPKRDELHRQIENLVKENERLSQKVVKLEELKNSSDIGSTESFVKTGSNVDSTESFEAVDADRADLLRKIDGLTRENNALLEKLTRFEEKGSSDTGSTESFERIPEHGEVTTKLENLTRENYELVVKVTKLEEKLAQVSEVREERSVESTTEDTMKVEELLAKLEEKTRVENELLAKIEVLTALNENLTISQQNVEGENSEAAEKLVANPEETVLASLESEIRRCSAVISEQNAEIEDMRTKIAEKEKQLENLTVEGETCELDVKSLRRELEDSASLVAEWKNKCSEMEDKLENLEKDKRHIEEAFQSLQIENQNLIEQKEVLVSSMKQEFDATISNFEAKSREHGEIIASQEEMVNHLKKMIENKELELKSSFAQLQNDSIKIDELQDELEKTKMNVQQKDATITSLKEALEVQRTNMSLIEEDLFIARHQLTDLQDKLDNSKSVEEFNRTLELLNEKEILVEELESKVSQKMFEINSLKGHADAILEENRQLQEQLVEEKKKVMELLEGNSSQEDALRNAERAKAEVENRLMDLQATQEENLRHANNVTTELRQAYELLEQLKSKHDEDMIALNHRLEDALEEINAKSHEVTNLQEELNEKSELIAKSVPVEVQATLESQLEESKRNLAEAEEKAQTQLEKLKKYAAVAKKKSIQCDELKSKLVELEEKLEIENNERDSKNKQLEESLNQVKEKDNRIADVEEKLERLSNERDEALRNMEAMKLELISAKDEISTLSAEIEHLAEEKEKARELSVRMEVMEAEYVDQLTQINSLKAENGFLLSRQAQINEKLENVEKESEERRALVEKLEKEKEIAETERSAVQESCTSCASRVQALEAKLQERNAEIENLDNELHNSIDNLVQMQENLRLSTIPDPALQESYNELLVRFNVLSTAHEETREKYEVAMRDNEQLVERITRLEAINVTLQERVVSLEKELLSTKETLASYEDVHVRYTELLDTFEKQKIELESSQSQLQNTMDANEISSRELLTRIEQLEQEKHNLMQEYESLKTKQDTVERQKRETEEVAKEESPPLFDASVFGASPAQTSSNAEYELEIAKLRDEKEAIVGQLQESRAVAEETQARLISELETAKFEINSLNQELILLNGSKTVLEQNAADRDEQLRVAIQSDRENLLADLEERNMRIGTLESQLEQLLGPIDDTRKIETKIAGILSELEAVKIENQGLMATQVAYQNRVAELETEANHVADLEARIGRVVSERDILQLELNDVNRAYQDLKEEYASLKTLQTQLDVILQEKNQLIVELEALRISKDVASQETTGVFDSSIPKTEEPLGESMWEDGEDPWGFNDKSHSVEQHVNIPIVPSAEIELRLKVDELEQQLKQLTDENFKLIEEGKVAQVKNVKYIKKLKEYKVQLDNMQTQLKLQKSIGGFGDLDSAIEEELKSQIEALEKALNEAKEEAKKSALERENLLKRIDVLTAATERFTESKEKQDTEVQIWQMRYKELEMKIQQLNSKSEEPDSPPREATQLDTKYNEELKELKQNVEALAAENEELQQLLEENRTKRQTSIEETGVQVEELRSRNVELSESNEKLRTEYSTLRKQYEQTLMDANDQVQIMRENCEVLKTELQDKTLECEKMKEETNVRLNSVVEEKTKLEDKIHELESEISKFNAANINLVELTELLNTRVQEVVSLREELQRQRTEHDHVEETMNNKLQELTSELTDKQRELDSMQSIVKEHDTALRDALNSAERLKILEETIENCTLQIQQKNEEIRIYTEKIQNYERSLVEKDQKLQDSSSEIEKCTTETKHQTELQQKLEEAEKHIVELNNIIHEKEARIQTLEDELHRLQSETQQAQIEAKEAKSELQGLIEEQSVITKKVVETQGATKVVDDLPVFTFASDNNDQEVQRLKAMLQAKNEEIEHLQYTISESSMTHMVQELQDNLNVLYNDKFELEGQMIARNQEIGALKSQLEELQHEKHQPQKRSSEEGNELIKLQNELHARDVQMSELKLTLAEKESQLQAALSQVSSESDSERLKSELYEKQKEFESLKFTISELQSEVANLRGLERLAAEDKANIQRLTSEKEGIRQEAEEAINRTLKKVEIEMNELKQRLGLENQSLLEALGVKERDIEHLKHQIEQTILERDHRGERLTQLESELFDRDRKLSEFRITKDTEIHNLQVELAEKNARLDELTALSVEEEKQLTEMRKLVEVKEQQINGLSQQLDEKVKEYELMQRALERHVGNPDQFSETQQQLVQNASIEAAKTSDSNSLTANELDVALYMLHQRDMRCEELTHELMQLLDERDSLQLRLSNAMRVNEELRKFTLGTSPSPTNDSPTSLETSIDTQPLIQNLSPSKSEGPVEIAKEAINTPIEEDKKALAQKLSQLKSLSHGKDVRLRDERELRHSQQMSLLAHKDVLSKLPPEAAARLVNANYTLSRDVQSQSSVLMNWLWGKSTPKVVHM